MKTPDHIVLVSLFAKFIYFTFVALLIVPYAMAEPASDELLRRGVYILHAGDCTSCHTARGGKPFAGGLPLNTPIGKIYSTNITPERETGIGSYTSEDFVKVMHTGVAKGGRRLYPAMPYTSFARVWQEDVSALYAYLKKSIEPVRQTNHRTYLSWPFGMRSLMVVWDALYFKKGEYVSDSNKTALWNRGSYLVQGLGHCGECHTPRGIAIEMKALSEKDGKQYLAGATLDNWHASPLTGDPKTGLHAWSKDEIVAFLKTGRTARVAAFGIMAEVVGKSTQYLTDQDLMAIAEYLKSLPASSDRGRRPADSGVQANKASAVAQALPAGNTRTAGAIVYLDNCNACHHSNGSGAKRTFPNLVRNEAVNVRDPTSLIRIVLTGTSMPSTQTAPSGLTMPDFQWRLSDQQVADVLSFVRSSWGNDANAVSHHDVSRLRKTLVTKKPAQ